MRVELLIVTDCPNERPTYERLRKALDEAGRRETAVAVRTVTEDTVASFPGFAGSPTVLIDGADPFADPVGPDRGLSCRVYRSGGRTSGAPSLDELRRAVAR